MTRVKNRTTPPPIEEVTTPAVCTAVAAFYLGREPKTLRAWSSSGSGPLRPIKVNGRLSWPVRDLRRVLGFFAPTQE